MKTKSAKPQSTTPKPITSWDDVVFDPAQFVKDMEELVDHYKGKKRLPLRSFRIFRATKNFTPSQISKLRQKHKLSLPSLAQILNVPDATVKRWESGERKPSGPEIRLLQILQTRPDSLLKPDRPFVAPHADPNI